MNQTLNTMNLLWGFDIEMACDEKGYKKIPDMNNYEDVRLISLHILLQDQNVHCMQGLVSTPRPFRCSFLPRSSQHEAVLRQEFRNMAGSFESFEQDLSEDEKLYAEEMRQKA